MALVTDPRRRFERVARIAAGLLFDGELLPWSRIARVGCVIDFGNFGTDDSDWLAVEDDSGSTAWIEVTGQADWCIDELLRGGLPDLTPAEVPWGKWHDSGPARKNLNAVIWPPPQRGRPMFRERAFGIWPFRRVRLEAVPAIPFTG